MISDKQTYYELASRYACGNRLRTWDSLDDLLISGYRGPLGIRSTTPLDPTTRSHLPYETAIARYTALTTESPTRYILCESAPDHLITLQGEVDTALDHMHYAIGSRTAIRRALRNRGRHSSLLATRMLLKGYLCPSSYSDLAALSAQYPDHVVEFSAYSVALGHFPGRNTIIWECRAY
jgi:hypothetical protein